MILRDEIEKAIEIAQKQYCEYPTKETAKLLSDFLTRLERVEIAPYQTQIQSLKDQVKDLEERMQFAETTLAIRRVDTKKTNITRMA